MPTQITDLKRAPVPRPRSLGAKARLTPKAQRCRRRFLRHFPGGFQDETYLEWERDYKWAAHDRFCRLLRRSTLRTLVDSGDYRNVANHAIGIESRTHLLVSFERLALRDAVRTLPGARAFAEGLWNFLYGSGSDRERFEDWVETVAGLPRRGARGLAWPLVTIFGFIAEPQKHMLLRPLETRRAAEAYGCELAYRSRPNWSTYVCLLEFAERIRDDQRDLGPRDMIDVHAFMRVLGADEYEL